ncbi:hypothetical protein ACUHMQ_20730, partial [Chitinimonas sp. PSY-7]|uniref:hypothetical protein n=1 Tax=Chitinimonas sp. PSY-7 TaxID=3459088 RepID=UPI0040402695
GRLLSTLDSAAPATTITRQYDEAGKTLTLTQVNGRVDTQSYDSTGQLIGLIKGSLAPVSYRYDANGNKIADIDGDGKLTRYVYDANQRLRYTVSPLGAVTEQRYDALGRVTETVAYATPISLADTTSLLQPLTPTAFATRLTPGAADRHTWQFYDQAGRLAKKVDAEGYVTRLTYDGAGKLLSETRHAKPTATNLQASLLADAVVVTRDAADRTTRYFYDADGNQTGVLDAAGYLTVHDYDGAGRLVHTARYATPTTASLRASGSLAALTPTTSHAQDQHSWQVYDSQNRLVGSVDAEGYLTEVRYDAAGRKASETRYATVTNNLPGVGATTVPTAITTLEGLRPTAHSEDRTVSYAYTPRGEVETETTSDGTVTRYTYNVAGNLLRKTTAANDADQQRSIATDYDNLGRITRELSAQGVRLTEQDTDSAKAERKRLGYPEVLANVTADQLDALRKQHATTYAYDNAG